MGSTKIEWATDSLPVGIYGCEEVSPACANCYAAKMAHRQVAMGNYPEGITEKRASGVHWTGKVILDHVEVAVERIRRFRRSRTGRPRVFVTSMADILHSSVPIEYTASLVYAMAERKDVDWLLLSKRAERWPTLGRLIVDALGSWPTHVWAGCTIEDRKRLEERAPLLAQVPAAVRWWSAEPLLGDLGDLGPYLEQRDSGLRDGAGRPRLHRRAVDWIVLGGESGTRARPTPPDWFRSAARQAIEAGVPVLFKQWGAWGLVDHADAHPKAAWVHQVNGQVYRNHGHAGGGPGTRPPFGGVPWALMAPLGKDKTGRKLNGREYDDFPEVPCP